MKSTKTLEDIISHFLHANAYMLQVMARWVQLPDHSVRDAARVNVFRTELRAALDVPGSVSTDDFERWTGIDSDSQEEVQLLLQEIWDACFGGSSGSSTVATHH